MLPPPRQVLGLAGDMLLAPYMLGHNIGGNTSTITRDVSATNANLPVDTTEAAKNTAEERKLAKEFAKLVADAIKPRVRLGEAQ